MLKTVVTQSAGGGNGTVTSVGTGTGLTGGPITTSGNISIANTGVTAATYGNASYVSQVQVNAQGQITSATNVAISIANSAVTGLGTMSTQNANAVSITGGNVTVTNVSAANVTVTTNLFANLTTNANATFATSSLPLVPEGYLIVTINGTQKKIPYYGV